MGWLRVLAVMASENALDSEEHDISDMVGHSDDEGSSGGAVWDDDWYAYGKDDDLEGSALMRDKFNIKYFSVNGIPYLEHSGNKVTPNESVVIIQNIDGV